MIPENQRLVRVRDTDDALTCIVCPIGCRLSVNWASDGSLEVTGNRCKRGEAYAREEFEDPRRVVTGTCAIESRTRSRLPVRSTAGVPVETIPAFLNVMYAQRVHAPIHIGDTVASAVAGTDIDLIATMTIPE